MHKVYLYILFAIIAMSINIYSQYLIFIIYITEHTIYIAMLIGTTLGLISKYLMDKIYIFKYQINTLYDYSKNFAAYVFTGFFTTLIFWSFEYSFYILFDNDKNFILSTFFLINDVIFIHDNVQCGSVTLIIFL